MAEGEHKGHRKRLRERYQNAGLDGLHGYEIVELLLTYSIPRKDVKPVAKELLRKFGSLSGIINANHNDLIQVNQISANSAILLTIIKDICSEVLRESLTEKKQFGSPSDVVDYAKMKIGGAEKEVFLVFFLNSKNHFLGYEFLAEGTLDHVVIYPRTIIEKVIAKKATGIILVHNHPSEVCTPSNHDIQLTSSIQNALNPMGTKLLDHIIVSQKGYFSFSEKCLL